MHRFKFSALSILPLLAFMCLSDTAAGQTISLQDCSGNAAASPLTFFVPANTSHTLTAAQESFCAVSSNGATTSMQASTTVNGVTTPWLYLNGSNAPVSNNNVPPTGWPLTVAVDTSNSGLLAGNNYMAAFQICYSNGNNCDIVNVKLTVTAGNSGGGNLSTNPTTLAFSGVAGGTTSSPLSASFAVLNSSSTTSGCTMSASTTTGGSWLLVNGALSAFCIENSLTNEVPITINGAVLQTLAVGTYNGTITITDNAGNQASVAVTLTVGGSTGLTATPGAFTFLYQIGQTTPASQTLVVSTNSPTTIPFTLGTSTNASWLVPSPLSSQAISGTPANITLSVNTTSLGRGTYTTNLLLNTLAGSQLASIPVTLVISNNPLLQLSTSSLTFNAAFAGQSPSSQTVQVTTTGTGGSVGFSANPSSGSASWLNVTTNSSVTPATLTVSINSGSLPVGTTTGAINVTPTNGDNYTETINVSVTVSNAAQITVGPSTLLFSYETKFSEPGSQSILVQSTGQSTTFTTSVTTNSCGNNWLSLPNSSGFTTPATLQVSVSLPSTTAAGVCTGTIGITPAGSSTPFNVSVSVVVSTTTPLLTIQQNAGFGNFTVQQGSASPNPQSLFLGSTDNTALTFAVQYNSDRQWLYTTTTNGSTPFNLGVNVNSSGLSAGTYSGSIAIQSTSLSALNSQFTIPITLIVTPNVTVTESPATMAFSFTANQTAAVASQSITLSSSGGTASYTASVATATSCPSGLLGLSPSSGSANGTIQVSIASTNFTAGTYTCQISLTYLNATNTSSTVAVTITVAPAITLSATPLTLGYAFTIGGTQPASQAITISSTGGAASFTVGTTTTGGGNWLTVDTTTGSTAGTGTTQTKTVNVSVNTAGLAGSAAGTAYTGSVTISSTLLATPITVAVTLTVTQPPNPGITLVSNNASNLAGVISPGELITLKGTLLGPATPANFTLNSSGGVANTLSGVQVTFDGIPGTPIYVSAVQINVTAPWEIAGRLTTNIVVTYNGNASAALAVRVSDFAPALYTINSTGSGQAAAINQNGTFNGPAGGSTVPAPGGSVVVLYATGCGQTSPPGITGSVSPTTQLLQVTAPVAVGFGPLSNPLYGKVLFIGAAPGLVTGVCQINVQLPAGLGSGQQFVTVTVGGVSSPQGPLVAIQ